MLIITRRAGEKIRVSNDICIEVIWAAVQAENAAAAKAPAELPDVPAPASSNSPSRI